MKSALLLIDIQNDYFSGGNMELVEMERSARNAQRLLARFREQRQPVVHVQHFSVRPGSTFFLPDTEGVEIHPLVQPIDGEPVIAKHFPNSFRDTDLLATLRKEDVEELVIAGAMSHMCVDATTRAAFDLGFRCRVVHDACATRDLAFEGRTIPAASVHGAFMAALGAVYAEMVSTNEMVSTPD